MNSSDFSVQPGVNPQDILGPNLCPTRNNIKLEKDESEDSSSWDRHPKKRMMRKSQQISKRRKHSTERPVIVENNRYQILKGYYFDLTIRGLENEVILALEGISNNGIPNDTIIVWVSTSENTTCSIRSVKGWGKYSSPNKMQIRIDSSLQSNRFVKVNLYLTILKKKDNRLIELESKTVPLSLVTKVNKRALVLDM